MMVDSTIRRLLEQAIDSPIKLQLCFIFYENQRMEGTASQLANRMYRDIWSVREALRELAEDGMLSVCNLVGEPVYRFRTDTEYIDAIAQLAHSYNEPLERDDIQHVLREIASYAPYQRANRAGSAFDLQSM